MRAFFLAAALGAVASLAVATPASAHTVGGIQPSNYRSEITAISPPLPGVSVSLYNLGHRVRLTNHTRVEVVVLGYAGEPFLRIGPNGVEENTASVTFLDSPEPPGAQPAAPVWRLRNPGTTATWADPRTFWRGPPRSGVASAPGAEQVVVAAWTITLQQGNTRSDVTGRIVWVPGSSVWPWLGLAGALALLALGAAFTPWWGWLLSACVAVLVAFDAVHTWGIAAAPGGGFGSQVGRVFGAGGLSVGAWVVGVLAIAPLQRRREGGLLAAAIAGAVIAIFGGLGDVTSLAHSQVPAIYPGGVVRLAVAVSLGLGVGLVAGPVLRLRALPVDTPPSPPS